MDLNEFAVENRGGGFLVCMEIPLKELSNWTDSWWFDIELTDTFQIIPEKCCVYLFGEDISFSHFPCDMFPKKFLKHLETEATKRVKNYLKLKAKDGKSQLAN